jgi:hypothetical protein
MLMEGCGLALRDFLDTVRKNPMSSLLPVQSSQERKRVVRVRIGKAAVDQGDRSYVESSSQLAFIDMQEYLDKAPELERLIGWFKTEQIIHAVQGYSFEKHNLFATGFEHGLNYAVEMYIQSNEQRQLDLLSS